MGLLQQIWRKMDLMIFAVTLLVWGSVVIVFSCVVVPWHWWSTLWGFSWTVLFSVLAVGTIVSWYRAMLMEPGAVPRGWIPPNLRALSAEEIGAKIEEYKRMASNDKTKSKYVDLVEPEFRYCKLCEGFKPERTHHCRECKRCVLMMDHHCPWVNNCIGHRNRKDFVQFLFYATTSQATAFGILVGLVVEWFRGLSRYAPPPHPATIVVVAIDMILLLAVCIAVGGLLWYQISCIVENLTTIDEYVMERQLRAAHKKRIPYTWPYDMGWRRNLSDFFGPGVLSWFVPGHAAPRGDGIQFERK